MFKRKLRIADAIVSPERVREVATQAPLEDGFKWLGERGKVSVFQREKEWRVTVEMHTKLPGEMKVDFVGKGIRDAILGATAKVVKIRKELGYED